MTKTFYKYKKTDKIWWIREEDMRGPLLFSFDKKVIFNFYTDYPGKLTAEQKAVFDEENQDLID